MKVRHLNIDGMLLFSSSLHKDERGLFYRGYCLDEFKSIGSDFEIKQTNISVNTKKHTLRGFHYQQPPSQESKVVTCVNGAIFNVTIDLRPGSATYLRKEILDLTQNDSSSIFIPAGCANAFMTLSDNTIVYYLMGDIFKESTYCGFRYNDPFFQIDWPQMPSVISEKDQNYPDFKESLL